MLWEKKRIATVVSINTIIKSKYFYLYFLTRKSYNILTVQFNTLVLHQSTAWGRSATDFQSIT